MKELTKLAVLLKKEGYPQRLVIGETYYAPRLDAYLKHVSEREPEPDYVRVPTLVNILNNMQEHEYELTHTPIDEDLGIKEQIWECIASKDGIQDVQFVHENIWVVIAKAWIHLKGKSNEEAN